MLKNYLRLALRTLRREKGYAFINALGLAVGLACCLLIGLFVYDELSYDRFHADADRLFLVTLESTFGGERSVATSSPLALSRAMEREIPGVEVTAATTFTSESPVYRPGTERQGEHRVAFADSTFLGMFSFPLVRGDAATALDTPYSVVVTQAMADAFFGDADPLGQTLEIAHFSSERVPYTVTGIFAPLPHNSFFEFEALTSISSLRGDTGMASGWGGSMYLTFARLAPGTTEASVLDGLEEVVDTHIGADDPDAPHFGLLPLTDLHLSELTQDKGFQGSTRYLLIFGSIAFFILFVALVNYMNLAMARAAQRVREVGVRKTLGATRGQIARQFLVEALLVTGAASVLGIGIASLALPLFNGVVEKELTLAVGLHPAVLLTGLALVVAVGLGAGSYPALYLSSFRPTRLLKQEAGGRGGAARLRKGLVVMQFAVTVVLLVATGAVYQQLRYVQMRDLGFAGEQVLKVPFADDAMAYGHVAVKQAVLDLPGVLGAAATSAAPGRYWHRFGFNPDPDHPDRQVAVHAVSADADYLRTLGLDLIAGRDFDPDRPSDAVGALILNESAAEMLEGIAGVGEPLRGPKPDDNEVIGIVKDYHFASLREPIQPVLIRIGRPISRRQSTTPSWCASSPSRPAA